MLFLVSGFDSFGDWGSILVTVFGSIATLIGAIATFVYKVRGKSFREIMNDLFSDQSKDVKELVDVVKTQSTVLKDVVMKELEAREKKSKEKN